MTEPPAGARTDLRRCPACGQKLNDPPPPRCPLCKFEFTEGRGITGEDRTPYAQAYAEGEGGLRAMARWVALADTPRLKHLALIRASASSRRFATIVLLLAAAGLGLMQFGQTGWRGVRSSAALEPTGSTEPAGAGWLHVAAAPRPLPADIPIEEPVDLWWNAAQSVIATVIGFLLAWVALVLMLSLLRGLANRSLSPAHRVEQRMSAAVHYGSVFLLTFLPAGIIATLQPIGRMTEISQSAIRIPPNVITAAASLPAALGVILWWFWLIRLGGTAPPKSRSGLVTCLIVAPLPLLGLAVAGWWAALHWGLPPLFKALGVQF